MRLNDSDGGEWKGQTIQSDGDGHRFRFQNGQGETLTGFSDGSSVVLRDSKGRFWKGIID